MPTAPVSGGSGAAVGYKENGGVYRGLCTLCTLPMYVARDWEKDTSSSRACNKRVLRPRHHSKGVLRETNIITGNARVCVLKRPASEWRLMGFHWGQEGQHCNYAGRLQMVASLCFSQTLITACEWRFSFPQSCSPRWIPGWKKCTYSPYAPT